ncbi:MAG: hypothetical protein RR758_09110, partial [Burkholderiaceae bacterium]
GDPRQPFIELLKKHGLDPDWISVDDLSDEGYAAFVRSDASITRRRIADGEAVKQWAPWPPALLAEPTFRDSLSAASQHLLRIHTKDSR